MTTAKKTTAKKGSNSAGKASSAAKTGTGKKGTKKAASLQRGQDPKGGLNAEGRRYFKEKEGLNLRPGVQGEADTPEKMVRKGSFLRRHFANPQGPVKDKDGKPTRQALEAAAWGEPVPKSAADEKKLADKGKRLLEQYHAVKDAEKKAKDGGTNKAAAKGVGSGKKAGATGSGRKGAGTKATVAKRTTAKEKRGTGTTARSATKRAEKKGA